MFPSLRERGCSPFCRSCSLLLALRTRPAGTSAYLLRSDQSETQGVDPERSRNAHHLSGAAAPLAAGGAGSRLPPPPRPLAPRRDSGISVFAGCSPTPLCSPSTLCPFLKKGKKKIFIGTDRIVSLAENGPASLPGGVRLKIITNYE